MHKILDGLTLKGRIADHKEDEETSFHYLDTVSVYVDLYQCSKCQAIVTDQSLDERKIDLCPSCNKKIKFIGRIH